MVNLLHLLANFREAYLPEGFWNMQEVLSHIFILLYLIIMQLFNMMVTCLTAQNVDNFKFVFINVTYSEADSLTVAYKEYFTSSGNLLC
jgi:hypothetical protein